jgi:AbrB family looped-hinge helix DNA binding protein
MKSRVSSKGQVTVPAEIRSKLGLEPGTIVQFEIHENVALMRKGSPGGHPVDRLFGVLRLRKPTDDLLDEMRGGRPRRP